jgi:hypothetical protein
LPAAVAKELPPNRLLFQKSDTVIRHPPMLRIKVWISKSNKTKRRSKHISALKICGPSLQLVRCAGNICLRSPARGLRGPYLPSPLPCSACFSMSYASKPICSLRVSAAIFILRKKLRPPTYHATGRRIALRDIYGISRPN